MKPWKHLLVFAVLVLSQQSILAQVSKDAVVQLEVTVSNAPKSLTLHWPLDTSATAYNLYRRVLGIKNWGTSKHPTITSSQYVDTSIIIGTAYEYKVTKAQKSGILATGYIETGVEVPATADRGILILLVDSTFTKILSTELSRLERDLWNDGYRVHRHDVARSAAVPDVKDIVSVDYNNDPDNTKALFIFGHVPIPYSGFLNPDGHPDHFGAWPADVFYGEFNNDWGDAYSDTSSGRRPANHNLAGDGKYDLSQIPDLMTMMIGRVDLSNMSAFSMSEKDLLKQYLDKDHNFRTGVLTAQRRGLIDDNFGYFGGEAFASSGWRNLPPMVGIDSMKEIDWFSTLPTQPYIWAYGCGGGYDQGAGGVGTTQDFAAKDSKAIFTLLFGSYFGDWNTESNFLRAPLCTSFGLTCAWSGRPYWQVFPMGLGEPIGYCARLSQNNLGDYVYNYAAQGVHIALMGDPTLVMHPYPPPKNLTVSSDGLYNHAELQWQPSSDKNIIGYNIYRSNSPKGIYKLLNTAPIIGTSYSDKSPMIDTNAYMVRAIKLETTPSGSYYNLSSASSIYIFGLIKNTVANQNPLHDELKVLYTPNGVEIVLNMNSASPVKLEISDLSGNSIRILDDRALSVGEYRYMWQTSSVPNGMYFVRAFGVRTPLTAKILVIQ